MFEKVKGLFKKAAKKVENIDQKEAEAIVKDAEKAVESVKKLSRAEELKQKYNAQNVHVAVKDTKKAVDTVKKATEKK